MGETAVTIGFRSVSAQQVSNSQHGQYDTTDSLQRRARANSTHEGKERERVKVKGITEKGQGKRRQTEFVYSKWLKIENGKKDTV